MNWEERIINDTQLRPFQTGDDFTGRAQALIAQQLSSWPALRSATAALKRAQYKKLSVKNIEMVAQFNPARLVSTAAKVDAATISARPCFLCPQNLPPEELGIAFGDDYVVLCNPFPVLRNHLVIAARQHTPQSIVGNFGALLDLARDLGDGWFALYNGPRCGASAPDHFHFQACAAELPVLQAADVWPFNLWFSRGRNRAALITRFNRLLSALWIIEQQTPEPMINLVVTFRNDCWTVIVYPRGKHRPARYDAPEPQRLTVSPAAIDLSGVLVVPQPEHFARINAEDVEEIYADVLLDNERWAQVAEGIFPEED